MWWTKQHRFILCILTLGFSAVLLIPTLAWPDAVNKGSADSLSFTAQCPKLLKEADDFAKDCLTQAREQVRYFHPALIQGGFGAGEREVHRVYFKEAKPGSHFSLGCSMNRDPKQIYFLGVYYATKSDNFKVANTAPIRYIDSDGNAGFWVYGNPINLIALRQFDTPGHPLTDWRKDRIKNCENATLPDEGTKAFGGRFRVTETNNEGRTLTMCQYDGHDGYDACEDNQYIDFFPTKNHQVLWRQGGTHGFISSGGDLMAEKDFYQKSCWPVEHRKLDTPNIAQEVCDQPEQRN
jgi:hypothetical protein